MENFYESFLHESENGAEAQDAARKSTESRATDEHVSDELQTTHAEIWTAILNACATVPKPLRHAFVVQVLVSVLEGQQISTASLHRALQKAFEAVQRVDEARQIKLAA